MTGGQVFDQSLRALAPLGRLVVFGMAGRVAPRDVSTGMLMGRSAAVIGFWLVHIVQHPAMLDTVADAHRSLLDRSSVGKLILVP